MISAKLLIHDHAGTHLAIIACTTLLLTAFTYVQLDSNFTAFVHTAAVTFVYFML